MRKREGQEEAGVQFRKGAVPSKLAMHHLFLSANVFAMSPTGEDRKQRKSEQGRTDASAAGEQEGVEGTLEEVERKDPEEEKQKGQQQVEGGKFKLSRSHEDKQASFF